MEPEEAEVCLRYIFEVRDEKRDINIFQLFDTREKKGPYRGKQKSGWRALQQSWQKEWQHIEDQGAVAKAPPCPEKVLFERRCHSKACRQPEKKRAVGY